MTDDQAFFIKLLNIVIEAGVLVFSEIAGLAFQDNEEGAYTPSDGKSEAKIQLLLARGSWRSFKTKPDTILEILTDPVENAITLAHEFGHHKSKESGERTQAYEAALYKFSHGQGLLGNEKELILGEESRAWNYAREVLSSLTFGHMGRYDTRRSQALREYRRRLDIVL